VYFGIVKHVDLYSGRCFQRQFSRVENVCPRKWVKINAGPRRSCDVETMRNNESLAGSLHEYRLLLPRGHINILCFACSNVCDNLIHMVYFRHCYNFKIFPYACNVFHFQSGISVRVRRQSLVIYNILCHFLFKFTGIFPICESDFGNSVRTELYVCYNWG
jgi:hypothetical protein